MSPRNAGHDFVTARWWSSRLIGALALVALWACQAQEPESATSSVSAALAEPNGCVTIDDPDDLESLPPGGDGTAEATLVLSGPGLTEPETRVFVFLDGAQVGEVIDTTTYQMSGIPAGMHSIAVACATTSGVVLPGSQDRIRVRVTESCLWAEDCEDGNPCSAEACVEVAPNEFECRYGWADQLCCISDFDCSGGLFCGDANRCVECRSALDCHDADECEEAVCDNGTCTYQPLQGECCLAADCDDGLFCTEDICDAGTCVNTPVTDPECCEGLDPLSECPGVTPCTAAACIGHQCVYGPRGGANCCVSSDTECDDANDCTADWCDSDVNLCFNEPDLSLEGCCENALRDCNDGDPATLDSCIDFHCENIPDSEYCDATHPCADDGNDCTQEYCLPNHRCARLSIPGCCHLNTDCLDGDSCTYDSCSGGQCIHTPLNNCCRSDAECADDNPCTLDVCIGARCRYGPDPALPGCCNDDAACEDGNLCTLNVCDLGSHTCDQDAQPIEGCCAAAADCLRPGDETGDWLCVDNRCVRNVRPCQDDFVCDDGDPCTYDYCSLAEGRCRYDTLPSCCNGPSDCNDGDRCTVDVCEPDHTCSHQVNPSCCTDDAECDDGDACTEDFCLGGYCRFSPPREGCCASAQDCDDGDECTLDICDPVTLLCEYEISPEFGCCFSDGECLDEIPSTQDRCINHRCEHLPIPNYCRVDADCDDTNECTADICVFGSCRFLPPNLAPEADLPDTCCGIPQDCPDDEDPCTTTLCVQGRCVLDDLPNCTRPLGFIEEFSTPTRPDNWTTIVDPAGSTDFHYGALYGAEPAARFTAYGDPTRPYEARLITPWVDCSQAEHVTIQFDQRRNELGDPEDSVIQVRTQTYPDGPWTVIWQRNLSVVSSTTWDLTTIPAPALAGRERARVALVYRALSLDSATWWEIDWFAMDRGYPPVIRTVPVDVEAPQATVTDTLLLATDADPWNDPVSYHKFFLPAFLSFLGYQALDPAYTIALLTGDVANGGMEFLHPYVDGEPISYGYLATLRALPPGYLDAVGAYTGTVEARGAYLRDRQGVQVLVLPNYACGNGIPEPGEECDDGPFNDNTLPNACRENCREAYCGDGVVDTGEECDPPTADGICRADCMFPVCGDGVLDPGEECDHGVFNSDEAPDACRMNCVLPVCGDNVVDSGEVCDDGALNGDPAFSGCLYECQVNGTIVLWPLNGALMMAFEDLPFGNKNDYDYNDWITDFRVQGVYDPDGKLWALSFINRPLARGGGYDHDQHIAMAGSLLTSDGTLQQRWFTPDGQLVREDPAVRFAAGDDMDMVSIEHTRDALPANNGTTTTANSVDCLGVVTGNEMRASIIFDAPIDLQLSDYGLDKLGVHGDGLFFDPYLHVRDTRSSVHLGDGRMLAVPDTWRWPEEKQSIWTVYDCVTEGDPPTFQDEWYYCNHNDLVWDPFCMLVDICDDWNSGSNIGGLCENSEFFMQPVVAPMNCAWRSLWVSSQGHSGDDGPQGGDRLWVFDMDNPTLPPQMVRATATCQQPVAIARDCTDIYYACDSVKVQRWGQRNGEWRNEWTTPIPHISEISSMIYHPSHLFGEPADQFFVGAVDPGGLVFVLDARDGDTINAFNVDGAVSTLWADIDYLYVGTGLRGQGTRGVARYDILPPYDFDRWAAGAIDPFRDPLDLRAMKVDTHEHLFVTAHIPGTTGDIADLGTYWTPTNGAGPLRGTVLCSYSTVNMRVHHCVLLGDISANDLSMSPMDGSLFTLDTARNWGVKVSADFQTVTTFSLDPDTVPIGITPNSTADLYSVHANPERVRVMDDTGKFVMHMGEGDLYIPETYLNGEEELSWLPEPVETIWWSPVFDSGFDESRWFGICWDAVMNGGSMRLWVNVDGGPYVEVGVPFPMPDTGCIDFTDMSGRTMQVQLALFESPTHDSPRVDRLLLSYLPPVW